MPPVYKPLTSAGGLTGAPGLPPEVFGAPQNLSIEDYDKQEALLLAQELANQQNEIKLQETQRVVNEQKQLRDAIASQYGGADTQSFDPDAALQTAQRIAIQTGDLDTALNIEKITKERNQGRTPLTPVQRQYLGIPEDLEGLTEKDVSLKGALDRGSIYGKSVEETINKRSDNRASLAPGGFESVVDPTTGQGPTTTDGKKFTATVNAHSRINSNLDMLEASLKNGGGNDPTSPEFQRQKAILGDIAIALKDKNGFGAALTANEERLNNSTLPIIYSRADVGIGEALVASGLGRDPFDAINTMRALLSTDFDQQAITYKFRPKKDSEGLPAAQSGTSFRIPRAGVTSGSAPFNVPGSTYSGVDEATGLPIFKRGK